MLFAKAKWTEIKEAAEEGAVAVIPIGSTEQHGPHLPVDVDINIPFQLARRVTEETGDLTLPPVSYGYNEKELDFPGTLSVKSETFIHYLYDICESLIKTVFDKILLLNGHGQNTPYVLVVSNMINEKETATCAACGIYVSLITDTIEELRESEEIGGMAHAGEFETSLELYLDPEHVEMDKAAKEIGFEKTAYTWLDLLESPPVYLRQNWKQYTSSGVVGDPTKGTKEKGEQFFSSLVDRLSEFLNLYREGRIS